MSGRYIVAIVFAVVTMLVFGAASAQDWNEVGFINHSTYQAVNEDGSSAYDGNFPIRFRGVVLNNTEDWLDSTLAYDDGFHAFNMGGQAEIFVQAVNLDGTLYDEDPDSTFDDFGGTACWMGQNYGNMPWLGDPAFSYTDEEWCAELGRLGFYGGVGVGDPIRAGDLVEIRVRAGLNYKGKMNVNEQHDIDVEKDFEVVLLSDTFGLPELTDIWLDDVKTADDVFIFDQTRQTGGERYQVSLVELHDVWVATEQNWGNNDDIEVTDGVRTFDLRLGLNDSFDGTALFDVGEVFNVAGIFDQADHEGKGGYRMLVMNAEDFTAIPEPVTLILFGIGGVIALSRRGRC